MTELLRLRGPLSDLAAGLRVRRLLPALAQRSVGPFVFFDHFGPVTLAPEVDSDVGGHPHIGLATVTFLWSGAIGHRDTLGSDQVIRPGDVNWMTAGRGLVHSELPEQEEGLMEGFQLWLNLPAKDKMREPWYRDIQNEEIPEFTTVGDAHVRVIAGASHGIEGAAVAPLAN